MITGLLASASLIANVVLIHSQPVATFYLLPSRLWELLLGVLAAATPMRWMAGRKFSEFMAFFGLALVGATILLYGPKTVFPGIAAIPPCLGTALLLSSGAHRQTVIGRALSLKPLVFFGLISYSLYLWHWPIIVLLKQGVPLGELSSKWKLIAFALSTICAWVSWRVVERPWRNPTIKPRTIFVWTGISAAVVSLGGALLIAAQGFPTRFSPDVVRVASLLDEPLANDFRDGKCFISSKFTYDDFDRVKCLARIEGKPNVLIMGDSHAAHLWSGLAERYPQINFEQATAAGCKPMLPPDNVGISRCTKLMRYLFENYLLSAKVDDIILAAFWKDADIHSVSEELDWFHKHGIRVILVGPIVHYDASLPQILALAMQRKDSSLIDNFRAKDTDKLDGIFADLAKTREIPYFSTYKVLCDAHHCRTLDEKGLPIQFDDSHLTHAGSLIVADYFPVKSI